jgi:hypothetical protein
MVLSHAQLTVVIGLLIAVAPAHAEQITPAPPPAQLQQTVPARPEPTPAVDGARATQFKAPVTPGSASQQPAPVSQQSAPVTVMAPAMPSPAQQQMEAVQALSPAMRGPQQAAPAMDLAPAAHP